MKNLSLSPSIKKSIYALAVFCFLTAGQSRLGAQIVYGLYYEPNMSYLAAFDVETCTYCNVFEIFPGVNQIDISILPDGRIALLHDNIPPPTIQLYTPPSIVPDEVPIVPLGYPTGNLLFNGLLYVYATNGLYYLDPSTNLLTFVGPWPPTMPFPYFFEMYESNGQVYLMQEGLPPHEIWLVDLVTPSNSTLVQQMPNVNGNLTAVTSAGNSILFVAGDWLNSYDPVTNTLKQKCNLADMGLNGFVSGLTYLPPGTPPLPCLCATDAGTLATAPVSACLPTDVQVPYNNDANLDSDDLLQYILFSDLTDTLGSILVTSNTPNIPFDPAILQVGVTYYLATIAGNDLNGNVDLNDPCLDLSNAAAVSWWPAPTVSFSVANPNVCAGSCTTLSVAFTGSPPFTLSGEVLSGANVVGTFNENYLQNNGTLNACAPLGTTPGSLSVQAVTLSDANCSCL